MLTGFHGFHVLLGATMLTVILIRLIRGHFTADHHFGFEGAAWYWHFVDVGGWACTCSSTGCDRRARLRPAAARIQRQGPASLAGPLRQGRGPARELPPAAPI